MALSDFIRKIEDSPRSIKVAVGVAVVAVGVAAVAVVAALVVVISQPDYGPDSTSPAPVAIVVTAMPTAPAYSAPSPTPQPTPVPTSTPPPTQTPKPQPTPLPTETPLPTATPTPEVNDYYVVIRPGPEIQDGRGFIKFYASYEGVVPKVSASFDKDDDFLSYLVREGVITSKQKDAYFKGERIPVPLLDISNAVYKMIQNEGIFTFREYFSHYSDFSERHLTHYADKSSPLDSNETALGGKISLDGGEGYVTISDGKISVSAVDDAGNTTTVNVEGVGAKELLDYWLSQNKITIEQKNQYGETGKIQFSLKDGVDLLDFEVSSDGGGSLGLDKDVRDRIVNEILPLFLSD